jgi:hypothetical protein
VPQEPSGVSVYSPKIRDEALVRKFVSLNGTGYVAISIFQGSTATDADEGSLNLAVWFNDVLTTTTTGGNPYGVQVLVVTNDSITKDATGMYHFNLGPAHTQNRGLLTAIWTYQVNGVAFQFIDHLQILDAMPLYDQLTDAEKSTVEQVTWMFGDLYDSTEGGPHLIEEFQTHWGYERIAQMLRLAVQKMNYIGNFNNPPTTWSIGGGQQSTTVAGDIITNTQILPDGTVNTVTFSTQASTQGSSGLPSNMYGLAVWGTYIECLRHFRDSYTEIPQRPGMDVTYLDRSQYYQRWGGSLQEEEANYKTALKSAKMSLLSMSRGSLLVSGGIWGGSGGGGIFRAGTYAAQVRSWRFYPAAPAISFGSTAH